MDEPLGLIAGGGRLPVLIAQGMKAAGRRVVAVSLGGGHEPELEPLCDKLTVVGLARLNSWIRHLRRGGARQAVMIGYVRKTRMYERFRFLRYLPDFRSVRFWFRNLRNDRRSNAMLVALADELAGAGIELLDGSAFISDQLAHRGVMTTAQPSQASLAEIEHGWQVQQRLGALDLCQAVALCGDRVLAVEALEGTDALIRRAGTLGQGRPWTLIKAPKPNQDLRLDLPVIGAATIENLHAAGATCLAIEAGKVIMVDKPVILAAADKAGIAIVGVDAKEMMGATGGTP